MLSVSSVALVRPARTQEFRGQETTVRTLAGAVCSSTCAELVAMCAALEEVQRLDHTPYTTPLVVCTDSQAALAPLASREPTSGAFSWWHRTD